MEWRALFLWADLCFVPATARAEEVRLSYTRLPGAESCPTEQTFRDLVAAQRGGLDPFTDRGPRRMVITIARRKGILQGKLVDVRYPRQTRRRLLR